MTHPLHGDNKLKLGLFGTNVSQVLYPPSPDLQRGA
jgi:hypothetical protein